MVGASGPQTGLMAEMVGVHVPVAPARVEMLATAPLEPLFEIALAGNGLYGRQATRGNLLFGGGAHEWTNVGLTTEPSKPNTPLIRNIARRLAELLPGAADVPVIRSWAGVVEQAPDYLPIIDILDSPSNYVVVTASAHGFGLTPATGKVVSDLVLHGESSIDISGLGLSRFADVRPSWREERSWTPAPRAALRPGTTAIRCIVPMSEGCGNKGNGHREGGAARTGSVYNMAWYPRWDSNPRTWLRRPVLYPLSYGGAVTFYRPVCSEPRDLTIAVSGIPKQGAQGY